MNRLFRAALLSAALLLLILSTSASADWKSWLKSLTESEQAQDVVSSALSEGEIADGLRQALGNGVRNVVQQLGKTDGFLANANVKIPVPKPLQMEIGRESCRERG